MSTVNRLAALRRPLTVLCASALAAILAGCTSSTPGGATYSYSGTWAGAINDSLGGPGTLSATMSQSGSNLVETWQAAFTGGGNNGGTLAGIINNQEELIELFPSNPNSCPFAVVGQRSGTTISGTYAAFNCTIAVTGSVSVTKQ